MSEFTKLVEKIVKEQAAPAAPPKEAPPKERPGKEAPPKERPGRDPGPRHPMLPRPGINPNPMARNRRFREDGETVNRDIDLFWKNRQKSKHQNKPSAKKD